MIPLSAAALGSSAALLFWLEPLAGKLLTPLLGGSPQVWVTCLLFFQVVLLAGYAYADVLGRRLSWRRQLLVHGVVLTASALVLPLQVPAWVRADAGAEAPVPWLLGALLLMLGPPFFALATHGPLIQRWFAGSGHARAHDPFFLSVASNLGSLLGLLAFPLLLEPTLPMATQTRVWSWGYGLCGVLALVLGWRARGGPDRARPVDAVPAALEPRQVGTWLGLAALSSSQLMAQTVLLQRDLAAVPLIWVLPLAVYLLTFAIAFTRWQGLALHLARRSWPAVALGQAYLLLVRATEPSWLVAAVALLSLAVGNLLCHARLAELRPAAGNLTRFYLLLSTGSALGGVLVAVAAPLLFNGLVEVPALVVLVCLALPADDGRGWRPWLASAVALLAAAAVAITLATTDLAPALRRALLGLPLILCYLASRRRAALALALAGCLLAGFAVGSQGEREIERTRSFFGVHRVVETDQERRLYHGSTLHNAQHLDAARRSTPGTYYHPLGPAGQALGLLGALPTVQRVGLLGMGAGALAVYGRPGQSWVFFEIDEQVVRLARERFDFLQSSPAAPVEVVLGDGRLQLARQAPASFDLLVLDAYASGAVPLHLLTVEAFAVYLRALSDGGVLLLHLSSRHLDLTAVVARLASQLGLVGLVCVDLGAEHGPDLRSPSEWAVLARHDENLDPLRQDARWIALPTTTRAPLFTDDFSSLLPVLLP